MRTIQIKATPKQFKQISDYANKIGVKIVEPKEKKDSKKEKVHPNILETRDHCKRIQNEIIKEYNKTAKVKAKRVV